MMVENFSDSENSTHVFPVNFRNGLFISSVLELPKSKPRIAVLTDKKIIADTTYGKSK
jgi:hypothetical protein